MKTLVVYVPDAPTKLLDTLKELFDEQVFLPMVVALRCETQAAVPQNFSIFPTFYSVNRYQEMSRTLISQLLSNLVEVGLYLNNSSQISSMYEVVDEIGVYCDVLGLYFEHLCEVVSFLLSMAAITSDCMYILAIR